MRGLMEQRDRRARAAVAVAYFVQGFCFAALLTHVNVLQKAFHFSDGDLSLVLLAVPVVAGVGSVLAGALSSRLGSAPVLRAGGPAVCLAITAVGGAGAPGPAVPPPGPVGRHPRRRGPAPEHQ